jgi:hypothetical protein
MRTMTGRTDGKQRGRPAKADAPSRPRFSTPLAHPSYSIEPCPNCRFPEADGGYCPECGWSLPVRLGRVS